MATSASALKTVKELAAIPWLNGVPNPSEETTAVASTFEEAISYLEKIAQLAQRMKDQDSQSYAVLKDKCWKYAKQVETSDQYLKIAAICVDCLGTLPADKPIMLLFEENEPLALPYYAKEYLERESPYFKQLFSGWSKDAKSPMVELPSLSLNILRLTLQQLDCSWLLRRMNFEGSSEVKDSDLIEVVRAADFLGLSSASQRAANTVIQRISSWDSANLDNISAAQLLIRQPEKYAHHPEVLKALQAYMDRVSKSLQVLVKKIESWSTLGELKEAKKIIESGLCQQQPVLMRALGGYVQKLMGAAQDAEEISKLLEAFKELPIIVLSGRLLVDDHIQLINQFPHLQCLVIQDRVEVEDLIALTHPSLSEIQFIRCQNISKKVLEYLSSLSLRALTFDSCGIKDVLLTRLKAYKLESLSLINCSSLSSGCLAHLRHLPLVSLSLVRCFGDSDFLGLAHLKVMKNLKQVTLDLPNLSTLAFLQGLSLEVLKLLSFGKYHLSHFVGCLKPLQIGHLILGGWDTVELFYHLKEQCKTDQLNIKDLDLIENKSLSVEYLTDWRADPRVKSLKGHSYPISKLIRLKEGCFASVSSKETILWDKNGSKIKEFTNIFFANVLEDGNLLTLSKNNSNGKFELEAWDQHGKLINRSDKFGTYNLQYNYCKALKQGVFILHGCSAYIITNSNLKIYKFFPDNKIYEIGNGLLVCNNGAYHMKFEFKKGVWKDTEDCYHVPGEKWDPPSTSLDSLERDFQAPPKSFQLGKFNSAVVTDDCLTLKGENGNILKTLTLTEVGKNFTYLGGNLFGSIDSNNLEIKLWTFPLFSFVTV